ncbi:MAG: DEAD/DEAH box helicase [Gammaproteobacteria bacterium]|nr:DEAD/DEAH box helicase [Gammaproteobacteria bacterium]
MSSQTTPSFADLDLPSPVLKALSRLGYETPSPIQAECIPLLLDGRDIIGQAQTGTGKTAAFALPLLSQVDLSLKSPQLLVLAPTRELAIQVAEAFQSYASDIKGFHVLPIYGGQSYDIQLRQLKRGVHVIVGTPGRVMDHINKRTLKLDKLQALVLDEADEMLRMGFIDDVEWIMEKTPKDRQIALFSATMPQAIQRVATKYLDDPKLVKIKGKTQTAPTIKQSFLMVTGYNKLDALTRILESMDFDAVLIFVRTKTATVDLTEKLEARGYSSAALNGDIPQKMRERTIERLKKSTLDIVVATDVAARGIDVSRISLVVNYDIPQDSESYVHRIGRTGRAGREGEAILFVTPKERHLLRSIERLAQHKIEPHTLPSTSVINTQRMEKFKSRIRDTIDTQNLSVCHDLIQSFVDENESDPLTIAAALVKMVQGDEPLLLVDKPERGRRDRGDRKERSERESRGERPERGRRERSERPGRDRDSSSEVSKSERFGGHKDKEGRFSGERKDKQNHPDKELVPYAKPLRDYPDVKMQRFRLDVGYQHEVKPGNVVGAIANEAEIDSCYIGNIDIYEDFTLVDLPGDMPGEVLAVLKKTRVAGRAINIKAFSENKGSANRSSKRKSKPKHTKRKGKRPAVAKRKRDAKK